VSRACVIGSGPNGLAAAIVLAQAGVEVDVFEAQAEPGGAARSLPLTLPGFVHDFGSAVHPLAAGSPFFSSLPLANHGLEWIQGDVPLAHPLDDGTAVVLERDLGATERALGVDGKAWQSLVGPIAERWNDFAADAFGPLLRVPKHPLLMAKFGLTVLQPARTIATSYFRSERTRAVFAGLAGHSFLSFDRPLSGTIGVMFGASVHGPGWPIPRGGAKSIASALIGLLESLGGKVHTSLPVNQELFSELDREYELKMFDTDPGQMAAIVLGRMNHKYRNEFARYKRAPGVFKVDYALREPVPWKAAECRRAITVHLGGSFADIAEAEKTVARGREAERPFVLTAQPTLFDPSRAPEGKHVLWAYCHVPNGSRVDMTEKIESQIERFAPGFRDCVLARHVSSPATMEKMNANLVGGDIAGGATTLRQILLRPTVHNYRTSARDIYICSASTPPGGGVHGMCGYHAAKLALRRMK
jgi:phytoene dehydrogenase-like protein